MNRVLATILGAAVALLALAAPASAAADGWSLRDSLLGGSVASLVLTPPANATQPWISGAVATGSTLTATTGTWTQTPTSYTYQWQEDTGGGFADIPGAATSTYTLLAGDSGASVRVVVTAANSAGSTSATSPAVGPVDAAVPTNTALPLITGSLKRGQTLVVSRGAWNPTGTAYTYQWQRDSGSGFADVSGATNSIFVLSSADVGATLRVIVTATNAYGATTATSVATGVVQPVLPTATQSPTIAGTARRTYTLSATTGVWSPAGTTLAYQWQRDDGTGWADVAGATTTTYTLGFADVGARIRFEVTGTDPDGSTVATSAATVTVLGAVPEVVTSPAITGANRVGETLTASDGTWSPAATSFAYQWQRSNGTAWTDISGATSSSYTVDVTDTASRLRVVVTATNAEGDGIGTSGATGIVTNPPTFSVDPATPTGTLEDTGILTADAGTFSPSTAAVGYQWVRCPAGAIAVTGSCTAVGVGSAYKLTADDVGHPMAVRVTASYSGGSTTVASPLTAVVQGRALNNLTLPQVTGTVEVASIAYVQAGTWSVPTRTVRFQWQRCDAGGLNCVDIPGASADRYPIQLADRGMQLAVRESVTSPGQANTATSVPVPVDDQPLPTATELPIVLGTTKRTMTLTGTQGKWANKPTRYTYQWQRCAADGSGCVDIAGATRLSYALTATDVGSAMTVTVSATNTSGTVSATAAPTAPVIGVPPVNRTAPVISGTMQAPSTVQAIKSSWETTSDTRYTFQWQRCDSAGVNCSPIAGATGQAYRLAAADVDHTLRVQQTATNSDATVTVTSGATPVILPPAPSVGAYPHLTIDGSPVGPGRTLTLTPATWFNATSTVPEFYRCQPRCVLIPTGGATWTYTITATDAGAILRAAEKATGPGGVREAFSPQYFGPVPTSSSGSSSLLSAGGSALVRTSSGSALATASVSATASAAFVRAAAGAGRTVRVTVRRASGARGRLRAWACAVPAADAAQPCTAAASLVRRATLRMTLAAGQRVRVVVTRRR